MNYGFSLHVLATILMLAERFRDLLARVPARFLKSDGSQPQRVQKSLKKRGQEFEQNVPLLGRFHTFAFLRVF